MTTVHLNANMVPIPSKQAEKAAIAAGNMLEPAQMCSWVTLSISCAQREYFVESDVAGDDFYIARILCLMHVEWCTSSHEQIRNAGLVLVYVMIVRKKKKKKKGRDEKTGKGERTVGEVRVDLDVRLGAVWFEWYFSSGAVRVDWEVSNVHGQKCDRMPTRRYRW